MGLLDKIFGNSGAETKPEVSAIPWKQLTTDDQLPTIVKESSEKPAFIFKHSTTCGISKMTLRQFEKAYDYTEEEVSPYFLDLLANRELSSEVANFFKVQHESPQLLVIKDGKVVFHTSHESISAEKIREFC